MSKLEQYYNEHIKAGPMPPFADLTESEKNDIRESVGFAFYLAKCATTDFAKEAQKAFGLLHKK